MPEIKNNDYQSVLFDSIKIGLASPDKIREWSRREAKRNVSGAYFVGPRSS